MGAEGASALEVISDVALFVTGLEGHVRGVTLLSLNLNVNLAQIVDRERLTVLLIKHALTLVSDLIESGSEVLLVLSLLFVVQILQESVVFLVSSELEWVLIQSEQAVVAVGKIGEGTALKTKSDQY